MKKLITFLLIIFFCFTGYSKPLKKPKKPNKIIMQQTKIINKDLLTDRYEAQIEIRMLDTKKTTWSSYYIYDAYNDIGTVGLKYTIKLGKSYIDKKIEELEKRIEELEND